VQFGFTLAHDGITSHRQGRGRKYEQNGASDNQLKERHARLSSESALYDERFHGER
jgi:hypothetical protein